MSPPPVSLPARDPGPLRSFNPVQIGRLECDAWVAYYRRQWPRLLLVSVLLVHRGFGLDWPRTLHGAWLVGRANQLWAPYPDNDPAGARRCMRRFYGLLRLAHGAPEDPARAATLEVDWWAAHRARQHAQTGPDDTDPLVTALTRLYAYLYRTGEPAVRPAARLRAEAMDLSDRWIDEGGAPDSPLIPAAAATLVRSYAALLAAVHR
jgi:hypothetical protein